MNERTCARCQQPHQPPANATPKQKSWCKTCTQQYRRDYRRKYPWRFWTANPTKHLKHCPPCTTDTNGQTWQYVTPLIRQCASCHLAVAGKRAKPGTTPTSLCNTCAAPVECRGCHNHYTPATISAKKQRMCKPCQRLYDKHARNNRLDPTTTEHATCVWCHQTYDPFITAPLTCSQRCSEALKAHHTIWRTRDRCHIPYCMRCNQPMPYKPAALQVCDPCTHGRRHTAEVRRRLAIRAGDNTITWQALGNRDNWKCHLCHETVPRHAGTAELPQGATVDHLIPIAAGGEHQWDNVALAHRACNLHRSHTGPAQLRIIG